MTDTSIETEPDAELSDMNAEELQHYAGRLKRVDWKQSVTLSGLMHELDARPDEIHVSNPSEEEIAEYDTASLYQLLGEIEQARYHLADVDHRVMLELDDREDA